MWIPPGWRSPQPEVNTLSALWKPQLAHRKIAFLPLPQSWLRRLRDFAIRPIGGCEVRSPNLLIVTGLNNNTTPEFYLQDLWSTGDFSKLRSNFTLYFILLSNLPPMFVNTFEKKVGILLVTTFALFTSSVLLQIILKWLIPNWTSALFLFSILSYLQKRCPNYGSIGERTHFMLKKQ